MESRGESRCSDRYCSHLDRDNYTERKNSLDKDIDKMRKEVMEELCKEMREDIKKELKEELKPKLKEELKNRIKDDILR